MAEKDESSLIGYDPLAWMHQPEAAMPPAAVVCPENDDIGEAPAVLETWREPEIGDSHHPSTFASSVSFPKDDGVEAPELEALEIETDSVWQDTECDAALEVAHSDTVCIVLEPVQTIQNVTLLHERLLSALEQGSNIDIDASAVTSIDTATLQLLLILRRTAIKQQKKVTIDFPSDRFIEASDLLGVSEMLEVDRAVAGFF